MNKSDRKGICLKKWFVWPVLLAGCAVCLRGHSQQGERCDPAYEPPSARWCLTCLLTRQDQRPNRRPQRNDLDRRRPDAGRKSRPAVHYRPDSLDLTLPRGANRRRQGGRRDRADRRHAGRAAKSIPWAACANSAKTSWTRNRSPPSTRPCRGLRRPLFISVDEEGGAVARLAVGDTFDLPPRYESAAAVEPRADRLCHGADHRRLPAYLRLQYGFRPDADVNTNPDNPIIGTRAFRPTPPSAADCALPWPGDWRARNPAHLQAFPRPRRCRRGQPHPAWPTATARWRNGCLRTAAF